MPAYNGKNLDVKWIHSGGTATLTGDYRTFSYEPSVDLLDQSAGADVAKTYVTDLKDGKMSFTGLMQDGASAGGTVMTTVLAEGASGTLIWSPEGTAVGKPKYTAPAICQGVNIQISYNGLTEISVSWQQNGARTEASN